jgi:streptomycin 6-kinase
MDAMLLTQRVEERIRTWGVVVEGLSETPSSVLVFGTRAHQPVVLKVIRQPSDEWHCGEVLQAFDGRGIARVYEYVEGAVLLERLSPATPLARLSLSGRDEEATDILAEAIQRMSNPRASLEKFVTVKDWARGFQGYLASGDEQIPKGLVEQGQHLYAELCATERETRLLHGDLQHYNVLYDSVRGWTAIDPKGVIGEIEYEIGASLCNPYELPELFACTKVIERRLRQYGEKLKLDTERTLQWGFAQAVLSAIWAVEDGCPVEARNPSLMVANTIGQMLK